MKYHLIPAGYNGTLFFNVRIDEVALTAPFQVAVLGGVRSSTASNEQNYPAPLK